MRRIGIAVPGIRVDVQLLILQACGALAQYYQPCRVRLPCSTYMMRSRIAWQTYSCRSKFGAKVNVRVKL